MKNFIFAFVVTVTLASCTKESPYARYGYEGKMSGQQRYMTRLGHGKYLSQNDSWKEKLDDRKRNFNESLKREYIEFANNLAKDKEYTDATYFRRKGFNSQSSNFNIFPENPTKWQIKNDSDVEDLRSYRLKLIDSLVGYTPVVDPNKAAKAIVSYDCWLQQAQGRKSKHNTANCKQVFKNNYNAIAKISSDIRDKDIATINQKYNWVDIEKPRVVENKNSLNKVITKLSGDKTPAKDADKAKATQVATGVKKSTTYVPPKKGQAAEAKVTATTATSAPKPATAQAEEKSFIADQSDGSNPDLVFIAYFDKATESLTAIGKSELDKTADQIKKSNPKSVSINGHTDRSYDSSSSLITSKKRADAVRDYLVSKGISKDIIRTYGFGKTDNLVENAEGEEKPANNRAEVIFKASSVTPVAPTVTDATATTPAVATPDVAPAATEAPVATPAVATP